MRHALLSDSLYKKMGYALIVGVLIILVLPWMNQKQLNYWLIGFYLFMLGDGLCTFLQHRSVNVVIGYIVAIIVCFLLLFYTISINN